MSPNSRVLNNMIPECELTLLPEGAWTVGPVVLGVRHAGSHAVALTSHALHTELNILLGQLMLHQKLHFLGFSVSIHHRFIYCKIFPLPPDTQ